MRRASSIAILLVLLVSLFLLSVLSTILSGYNERIREDRKEQREEDTIRQVEKEPSVLLFKVSPVMPQLYWRVSSADYYTGFDWLRTTDEKTLEEFPQFQNANATEIFTVEINARWREIFMPLASPNSAPQNVSLSTSEGLTFHVDTVGNVYKVMNYGQSEEVQLVYEVSWLDIEVDDKLISLDNIPEEILNKYLQLPDIPIEVSKLAEGLEDSSYSVLDQVLVDIQFLRANFVYDFERSYLYKSSKQGSDVSSYMKWKKGTCIDAATALAVILRIQKIPARISFGYKPERMGGDRLLYYATGAHSVTEVYLSPYGWVQFDATPPLEKKPSVKLWPFKKLSLPGSRLFYQLSITNRRNSTDIFMLSAESKQKWNTDAAPAELRIEASQTVDALLAVTIPDDANLGEKDIVTVTVASLSQPQVAFSILAVIQVENVPHIYTTTTIKNTSEAVIRGDTLWVNGTVLAASGERVDNMTVFIFLTKSTETEGVIVSKGYSKQGNFQIECVVPYFMEIGDYKIVPISLGTTYYAPSSSDSIIKVCATTRMELGSEEEFLLGYGAIHGHLLWDNGTCFANAPISLETNLLATPSEVWKLQNLTFEDGSFRIETAFENPGVYEVKAMFSGNEYILGSSATRLVKLKFGQPVIQIFGENIATRGEFFNIEWTIRFEDIGVWGEPVTVAFDNQLLSTIETKDNGSYTWSFLVDPEEKLGSHIFIVALRKGDLSAVHMITVKSKTKITTKVSDVAGGMFLLFSASLSDDHGRPIQGTEIVVDNYGLSWKTDKNGRLEFLLDTIKLWPGDLVLTARFEGSELYLPVTTEEEVVLEPMTSLPLLIPLVAPTLAVIVFVYTKHHMRWWQTFQKTSEMEVLKERAMVEEEPINRPQKMPPLKIILLDIEGQFPNVWGANDKLRIEIVLNKSRLEKIQKREVEVLVDKGTVASTRLSPQGRAELSHVFIQKGEHMMKALLPRTSGRPWNAEIRLRVVDYAEEIIRLYNEFLGKLASYGIHARDEMTSRDIEGLILRMVDSNPEALHKVTTYFDKAEYSDHLATRKDYEIMYLSLKELNFDVEQKE